MSQPLASDPQRDQDPGRFHLRLALRGLVALPDLPHPCLGASDRVADSRCSPAARTASENAWSADLMLRWSSWPGQPFFFPDS
jgi:hypothetical protein